MLNRSWMDYYDYAEHEVRTWRKDQIRKWMKENWNNSVDSKQYGDPREKAAYLLAKEMALSD